MLLYLPAGSYLAWVYTHNAFGWIKINSVTPPEKIIVGSDPDIKIDRAISKDFRGTYTVTVRNALTNRYICQGDPPKPIDYRTPKDGHETSVPLSWWLWNTEALDECWRKGMAEPGAYYMETCHTVLTPFRFLPWVRYTTKPCNKSEAFEVVPADLPDVSEDFLYQQQQQITRELEELKLELHSQP